MRRHLALGVLLVMVVLFSAGRAQRPAAKKPSNSLDFRPGLMTGDEKLREEKKVKEALVATLEASAPVEFGAYRKAVAQDDEMDTALAVIQVVLKAKGLANRPGVDTTIIGSYRTAWELCLDVLDRSKSADVVRLIIAEWDSSLNDQSESLVAAQIDALLFKFDRRLMTGAFWSCLENSNKRKVVSSMCYVLYKHGDQEAIERISKRLDAMPQNHEFRNMLQSARDCLQHRLDGGDMKLVFPVFK